MSAKTFGAYDPRFLGTQVTLQSPEALATFNEMYVERKVLKVDASDPKLVDKVLLGTVLEHEVRHFHDALLSPFSAKLLRLRMEIAVNFDQVFDDLATAGFATNSNCAFIPAELWIELSTEQRRTIIRQFENTGFFGTELRPLPMPIIPNQIKAPQIRKSDINVAYPMYPCIGDELFSSYGDDAVEAKRRFMLRMGVVKDRYDQVDFFLRGLPFSKSMSLQPWDVFECSAILVQMYAAHESCIGFSPSDFLRKLYVEAPRYTRALSEFFPLTTADDIKLFPRAALLAATWALFNGEVFDKDLRDWDQNDQQGSIPARFLAAVSWFKTSGFPKADASALKVFAELDDYIGGRSWEENLELSLGRNLLQAEKISDGLSDTADIRTRGAVLAFVQFVETQRTLLTSGIFNLQDYTQPEKYLALANKLPQPPTLFHVQGLGSTSVDFVKANARSGWFPVEKTDINGTKIVSVAMAPHPTMSPEELLNVWHLFNFQREIDHLFSRHHRNEHRAINFDRLFKDRRFKWIEFH
ncbi:hypothetical protein [Rhizobium leguminosarum]|uniref:hypothetical protein n=1 Tax=Rhizobium leguminosarum TaxID=384 RepID=UPI0010325286|nr:hypothetical protein [Rhizobium leguminosarum]TAX35823.1 hypothetical protein ELI06_16605 [Rhizobium leguminosarum]